MASFLSLQFCQLFNLPGNNPRALTFLKGNCYLQCSIMAEKASQQAPEQQFLEIAAEIAQCNYNVRQFKKVHHSKHLKICQPQKNKIIARLSTEPNPIRQNNADVSCSSIHARTLTDGLDKTLRFNSTFIPPQNSKTKKPFFSKSTGSENFGRYRSEQKKPRAKEGNHLERYEQKWSKEKLNQRYLEGWLNSILIEYCHNEYFDHKIPNCALKKLGIDQNSLVAKGLKASHVGRLYRSLFVFGMGYNELTKEMSNGNPEVGKIIWKIYSIILEYCSKGNLETVIGDIQRQNELIVSQLAGELERKQAIIEKSEELNQRRNNQIFKEIKSLRQENINLKNEKAVLLDEHSSTEQAFAQQINLRLKFETKINQIYGLHRQLGLKHQKLYNELVKKIEQLKKESQRYFEVAGKISQYKQVQANLREKLVESKQKMNRYAQHLKEANSHSMGLSNQICNLQYEVDCLKSLYNEIRVKEKQWAIEKANMQVMVEMREKSTKETFKEYQLTLQQNNRLYIMISDQRKTMEDYQKEKKNFNSKIISIVAENSFNKRKLEEIGRKYEETLANSNKATQKLVKLKEENEIITKIQTSSRSHFGIVEEKLNEMHRLNLVQSEQLVGLRAFQQAYNKVISQKNTQAQHLRGQAQQKSKAAQKLNVECRELQSKNAILSEKLAKTQTQLQLKQAQLIAIYDQNQQNNQHLNKTVMEQISEIQKIRNQFEIVLGQYKNQKFQRNSLNTIYIQALRTIESKNTEQRNLRVKISLIQGDYSKIKNNYSILQKSMIKLVANFSQQQQKLEQSMQQQRLLIYERQQYVHPMVVEELRTRVVDLKALEQANQQQIELLKINLQKERIFGRQQLQKSSSSFRWEINRIKVQNERALEALKNELVYAKEQWGKLKKKAEELQEVAESYRKKIFQKTTSERQQVYKYMMEQKSKQIENMLKEMQILQDQLRDSKRMLAQSAPQDPLLSVDELRNTLEQSIRRQLSHQYDLKMRETHRSVKAQYLKKQNQLKNDFENSVKEMSVEQLFKIRNVTAQQLKAMVSSRYPFQFSGQDLKEESEGRANEKRSQNQEARARNQIGRLMKNAYQYYQS